jgi:uncharacterized protein (TIGR03084 family)
VPSEPTTLETLIDDLEAERSALDTVVAGIDERSWNTVTAATWTVKDQIGHLAFFDEAATSAVTTPDQFRRFAAAAIAAGGDPMEPHLTRGRTMSGSAVLEWWREARSGTQVATRAMTPNQRVPWFGPDMGALSFVSARLMETWAHGQDVAAALGVSMTPTARLRHVAHLGVKARPFSYAVNGLDAPMRKVTVDLQGPAGERWCWDDGDEADGAVRGPALDFCLVVTQRRHIDDTDLIVEGEAARQWMSIAQAFAGPPGPGRRPVGKSGGGSSR